MAEKDKIRLLRGLEADIPAALPSGCPAFSTDTHKLFVGTGAGRKEIAGGGGESIPIVSTMPDVYTEESPIVSYIGEDTFLYKKGHLYYRKTTQSWEVGYMDSMSHYILRYSPNNLEGLSGLQQLYVDAGLTIPGEYADHEHVYEDPTSEVIGNIISIVESPEFREWKDHYKELDKLVKLDKCITTDGGTFKGDVTIDTGVSIDFKQSPVKKPAISSSTGYLFLCGADKLVDGACLGLYSTKIGNDGEFSLVARNSLGSSCQLLGKGDGTLKWNGNKIETQNNKVTTVSDESTDDQYPTAKAAYGLISTMFDMIYPIGSYAFGQHPTLGTWTEVTGDRALWLKSSAADGTTISQALPNVKGGIGRWLNNVVWSGYNSGPFSGPYQLSSTNMRPDAEVGSNAYTFGIDFNLGAANSIYKDGANVQPNAYVMKVWKRTA